jgi:hypothetical protein
MPRKKSTKASSSKVKPDLDIFNHLNEFKLPSIMPPQWGKTAKKHASMAYDPDKKKSFDLDSEEVDTYKEHPFKNLITIKNSSIQGTKSPAISRLERYNELKEQNQLIVDENDKILAPCLAHGDYVEIASLQSDHIQPKADILERQKETVNILNQNPEFAEKVMALDGMDRFFVKADFESKNQDEDENTNDNEVRNKGKEKAERYYGTLFFYEVYFNEIDNLWLICQACNLHKGKKDTLKWLTEQWAYGEKFFSYLERRITKDHSLLDKLNTGEGLATVAIKWFWKYHNEYITTCKSLIQDINVPIKILGRKIERNIENGKLELAEDQKIEVGIKLDSMGQLANTNLLNPKNILITENIEGITKKRTLSKEEINETKEEIKDKGLVAEVVHNLVENRAQEIVDNKRKEKEIEKSTDEPPQKKVKNDDNSQQDAYEEKENRDDLRM